MKYDYCIQCISYHNHMATMLMCPKVQFVCTLRCPHFPAFVVLLDGGGMMHLTLPPKDLEHIPWYF